MPRASLETSPRFTMEIPLEAKARLMRAAATQHLTLKDFMLGNALRAADAVLEQHERMTLSERDTRRVLELLDNPPKANARLVAAVKAGRRV